MKLRYVFGIAILGIIGGSYVMGDEPSDKVEIELPAEPTPEPTPEPVSYSDPDDFLELSAACAVDPNQKVDIFPVCLAASESYRTLSPEDQAAFEGCRTVLTRFRYAGRELGGRIQRLPNEEEMAACQDEISQYS